MIIPTENPHAASLIVGQLPFCSDYNGLIFGVEKVLMQNDRLQPSFISARVDPFPSVYFSDRVPGETYSESQEFSTFQKTLFLRLIDMLLEITVMQTSKC